MSEYQYIEFLAIDRPLTDTELAFARKQSTRAEISEWSFQNHYEFGNFHGDVIGLLRRGYDVHLHYANFGIRTVAFRFPAGLPFPDSVSSKYIGIGQLSWKPDRRGKGGVLFLAPYYEVDALEELWDFEEYMLAMVEVRRRLFVGDLRALYVLWLAAAFDDQEDLLDSEEPPVPAGLGEVVDVFEPFLEFFGLDPLLLVAASEGSMAASGEFSQEQIIKHWVESQSEKDAKLLLQELLSKDSTAVKAETIAKILGTARISTWPTTTLGRTAQELLVSVVQLRHDQDERDRKRQAAAENRQAAKRARDRQDRIELMAKEPKKWLSKADQLVAARGVDNYEAAAEILAELREAFPGDDGEQITYRHASHLAKKYPTLNRMKSSLRKRGLLR